MDLYACRPVTCVPFTKTHCHLRLYWNRDHALGGTKIVGFLPGLSYGERLVPITTKRNIIERHRFVVAVLYLWEEDYSTFRNLNCMGNTSPYLIGNMASQLYRDIILEQHARLFRGGMSAEFCV
ncbi:transposable element Tcb1 transposase [Trichonephila clavipes]|nr:transposable element Tcb1 transposase [Trichonephila clavipes]